jgi:hypothetical protein
MLMNAFPANIHRISFWAARDEPARLLTASKRPLPLTLVPKHGVFYPHDT